MSVITDPHDSLHRLQRENHPECTVCGPRQRPRPLTDKSFPGLQPAIPP